MILKRLLSNSFFQGSVVFTFSSFLVNILNYLFSVLVAQRLGPSGFGEVSSMFAYIAMFSVPMSVMSMVLIQKIGQQRKNQVAYAASLDQWFKHKLASWWPLLILLCAIFPFVQIITKLSFITSLAVLPLIIIGTIGTYYISLLQGLHLLGWVAGVSIIAVAMKLLGILVPLDGTGALISIIIALLTSSYLTILIPRRILRSTLIPPQKDTFLHSKRLSHVLRNKQVVITLISLLSITMIGNFDIVSAKRVMIPEQAGIYSSWVLFSKIILYGLGPVITMSYIFFSSKKNEAHHDRLLVVSLVALSMVGCTAFLIYSFLGRILVSSLFSATFVPVTPFLWLASIFGTLYAGISLLNSYFLSRGSMYGFIVTAAVIPYIIAITAAGRSVEMYILASIAVTGLVFFIQLCAVIQYNYARWKQNKHITSSA